MDTYQIDSEQLWYYMLYPIIIIGVWSLYVVYNTSPYGLFQLIPTVSLYNKSNAPTNSTYKGLFVFLLYTMIILSVNLLMYNNNIPSYFDYYLGNIIVQVLLFGLVAYSLYVLTIYIVQLYPTSKKSYESFDDASNVASGTGSTSSDVAGTLQRVQTITQSLQDSISIFITASDDTCSVIKAIEQKYIDNATSPSGNGTPPSKEEAAKIKAQKLPAVTKQWNQKKQLWADAHEKIPIVECFAEESLQDLINANKQLSELLSSPSVKKIVEQIKRVQTSNRFAEKYMEELTKELDTLSKGSESFEDLASSAMDSSPPSLPCTITESNKLIKLATTIQSQIKSTLESTNKTKNKYDALDAKANDPDAVSNLAGSTVG